MSASSLLATIGTSVSEHFVRLGVVGDISLSELYTKLTNYMYELRIIGAKLRAFLSRDSQLEADQEVLTLLDQANQICGFINTMNHSLLKRAKGLSE
jgi:hypothetical protein